MSRPRFDDALFAAVISSGATAIALSLSQYRSVTMLPYLIGAAIGAGAVILAVAIPLLFLVSRALTLGREIEQDERCESKIAAQHMGIL